jgi:hypothetical protein
VIQPDPIPEDETGSESVPVDPDDETEPDEEPAQE